jgi:hypothetical protein
LWYIKVLCVIVRILLAIILPENFGFLFFLFPLELDLPEFWNDLNINDYIIKADKSTGSEINFTEESQLNDSKLSENTKNEKLEIFQQKGESSSKTIDKLSESELSAGWESSDLDYDENHEIEKSLKLLKEERDYAKNYWDELKKDANYNSEDEASCKKSYEEAKEEYENFKKLNIDDSERSDYESEKDKKNLDSNSKSKGKGKNVVKPSDIE